MTKDQKELIALSEEVHKLAYVVSEQTRQLFSLSGKLQRFLFSNLTRKKPRRRTRE